MVDQDQYFVARKGTMMTLIISTAKNLQCNWFLSDSFSVGRLHLFKKPVIYSLNHCNYERYKSWCNELNTLFNSICFAHWVPISDTNTVLSRATVHFLRCLVNFMCSQIFKSSTLFRVPLILEFPVLRFHFQVHWEVAAFMEWLRPGLPANLKVVTSEDFSEWEPD